MLTSRRRRSHFIVPWIPYYFHTHGKMEHASAAASTREHMRFGNTRVHYFWHSDCPSFTPVAIHSTSELPSFTPTCCIQSYDQCAFTPGAHYTLRQTSYCAHLVLLHSLFEVEGNYFHPASLFPEKRADGIRQQIAFARRCRIHSTFFFWLLSPTRRLPFLWLPFPGVYRTPKFLDAQRIYPCANYDQASLA